VETLRAALVDLEALLISPGTPGKPSMATYNRARYNEYAADPKKAFNSLYMFCFALAKPEYVLSQDGFGSSAHMLSCPDHPGTSTLTCAPSSPHCLQLYSPAQIAAAMWSVVLAPRRPLVGEFVAFVQEKGTVRAVTKDLWTMVRDFAELVQPDLSDYEADGVRASRSLRDRC
jgi:DCN1-like protein 4/5